jgi:hypothetical protein
VARHEHGIPRAGNAGDEQVGSAQRGQSFVMVFLRGPCSTRGIPVLRELKVLGFLFCRPRAGDGSMLVIACA